MVILDGRATAAKVKGEVRERVLRLARRPGLAVILVGDNPASRIYVDGKRRDCSECGIYSEEYALPASISEEQVCELIGELGAREDIDGILLQLPLPGEFDAAKLTALIPPDKDVDGFHPMNAGLLAVGTPSFVPCTPAGVLRMLDEYGIAIGGKRCVVIGRSNIVGKPMAQLMLMRDATVTSAHSKTADLGAVCREADILISAAGVAGLITADMVKDGAVVIDVAMNRDASGRLCGDVCFDEVADVAGYITPVPGGVGPMTRAMLMEATLSAALSHMGRGGGGMTRS